MNTKVRWRQHLTDMVNVRLDPVVYAMQWARDPRCLQSGAGHRRVGGILNVSAPVCSLWSAASRRSWG